MNYGGHFDLDSSLKELENLKMIISKPDFWENKEYSEKIITKHNNLNKKLEIVQNLKFKITDNYELATLLKEEYDEEIKLMIKNDLFDIEKKLEHVESLLLLDGKYDKHAAIFEIHSGAGGTEANDWVAMLYRMYNRHFEKKGYNVEVLSEQKGDEVGFKNIIILVKGDNAYGLLKNESGVHRLIRISPFDSNKRRHTSFASVEVVPYFDEEINIDIKESDLLIDVYKSSGAGGQSVNTTDSAVRITHLPTKIVVTCQNERSQIQNKERALEVLKNKLYNLEKQKQDEQLQNIKGGNVDINFGSQIRSYILHPYSMVKDHRTNTEVSNVYEVLDGELDVFIYNNLKKRRGD